MQQALTLTLPPDSRELKVECGVAVPSRTTLEWGAPEMHVVTGVWDTGATGSMIVPPVAAALGIQPIDVVPVVGVESSYDSPVYLVDLYLPSLKVPGLRVTVGRIGGAQMLVGMDVISRGDFALTNNGGVMRWTFATPSERTFDFVAEGREMDFQGLMRAHGRKARVTLENPANGETETLRLGSAGEKIRQGWRIVSIS